MSAGTFLCPFVQPDVSCREVAGVPLAVTFCTCHITKCCAYRFLLIQQAHGALSAGVFSCMTTDTSNAQTGVVIFASCTCTCLQKQLLLCAVLQLQTMRMRCEKKKQKDAERRQEELTTEELAEQQARADAYAQVHTRISTSTALLENVLWILCLAGNAVLY